MRHNSAIFSSKIHYVSIGLCVVRRWNIYALTALCLQNSLDIHARLSMSLSLTTVCVTYSTNNTI